MPCRLTGLGWGFVVGLVFLPSVDVILTPFHNQTIRYSKYQLVDCDVLKNRDWFQNMDLFSKRQNAAAESVDCTLFHHTVQSVQFWHMIIQNCMVSLIIRAKVII